MRYLLRLPRLPKMGCSRRRKCSVVARLSEAIQAAMRVPAMRDRMAELGYDAVGSTAEELSTFQQSEITRTAELVRISGATVE